MKTEGRPETMYAIDWDAIGSMEPEQRLTALTLVLTGVQEQTRAERCRTVRECVDRMGTFAAAARELGITAARVKLLYEAPQGRKEDS